MKTLVKQYSPIKQSFTLKSFENPLFGITLRMALGREEKEKVKNQSDFVFSIFQLPQPFILKSEGYSFQEFLEISNERGKWEILEGTVVMHSPASFGHEEIVSRIITEFSNKLSDIGKVFASNAVYRLGRKTGLAPDVSFVKKERLHLVKKSYFQGPPDIAVEVISRSTQNYDLQEKLPIYMKAGVPIIIYVFPDERKVVVWERKKKEYKESTYTKKGKLKFFVKIIDISKFFG